MTDNWSIRVGEQIYGPYTRRDLEGFVKEGRLASFSLVAPSGSMDFQPAGESDALQSLFTQADSAKDAGDNDAALTRYVIIADMKSRSIAGVESEIFQFGSAYAISPQGWVLVSATPLNVIRNALMQQIGNVDHLFIADVTHNKAVWFNYGPEAESRIRQTWLKA